MEALKGFRKLIMFAMALIAFVVLVLVAKLEDPASILAAAGGIATFLGGGLLSNLQSAKLNAGDNGNVAKSE